MTDFDPTTARPTGFDPSTAKPSASPRPANIDPNRPFMGMFDKSPGDVDYRTGLTIADRTALNEADNSKEKLKYLRGAYGDKNVKQLDDGTLIVTKDGKQIAAESGSPGKGLVADVAAAAPEITGMAIG